VSDDEFNQFIHFSFNRSVVGSMQDITDSKKVINFNFLHISAIKNCNSQIGLVDTTSYWNSSNF